MVNENYLDIEDLIAENYRFSVVFQKNIQGLGHIIPGNSDKDILLGTKIDLAYWAMISLLDRRIGLQESENVMKVSLPKAYTATYRDIFLADATVVNLKKLMPSFYVTGIKILKMFAHDSQINNKFVVNILNVFKQRFSLIYDAALCGDNYNENTFIKNTDNEELSMYQIGLCSFTKYRNWILGKSKRIQPVPFD
ncbi:DNA replication complex GINS protein PSF3 [Intoshia linei]|uniref:DNA replication complex GINS protein PSF3 n=1 Tax=Intoshia linei TaxID=1819745 RepID=A0A177B9I4_9BILA|nr:DNA replication complex GINS protein PSF3 [Intoshia linei]